MSIIESWLVVLGLAIGTFLIRYSFIGLFANRAMPKWLEHGLKLLVPAIFAAIVATGLFISAGQFGGWTLWPRYAAAVVAFAVAVKMQGNILATVSVGMLALHVLTWLRDTL
jgi:branched-subunit amino acid transport protein